MVNAVSLYFIEHFHGVGNSLRHVAEDVSHLLLRLKPLLLGVVHTVGVGVIALHGNAYQTVVSIGVALLGEMDIVGGHHFYAVFAREVEKHLVYLLLLHKRLAVGILLERFVALQLKVVIVAEDRAEPEHPFFGQFEIAVEDMLRQLTAQTGREYNESLVMLGKCFAVGAGMIIMTLCPCLTHQLNQVVITLFILCKDNEVIPLVVLVVAVVKVFTRHIHFAT